MGTRGWRVSLTTSCTERCVLHSLSQPPCSSSVFHGGMEVYTLEGVLDGDKRTETRAVEGTVEAESGLAGVRGAADCASFRLWALVSALRTSYNKSTRQRRSCGQMFAYGPSVRSKHLPSATSIPLPSCPPHVQSNPPTDHHPSSSISSTSATSTRTFPDRKRRRPCTFRLEACSWPSGDRQDIWPSSSSGKTSTASYVNKWDLSLSSSCALFVGWTGGEGCSGQNGRPANLHGIPDDLP